MPVTNPFTKDEGRAWGKLILGEVMSMGKVTVKTTADFADTGTQVAAKMLGQKIKSGDARKFMDALEKATLTKK